MDHVKCLHCNALLTWTEREEGWCDSCGKRLPSSVALKPTAPPAAHLYEASDPMPRPAATRPMGERFFSNLMLSIACGVIGVIAFGLLSNGTLAHIGGVVGYGISLGIRAARRSREV